MDKRTAFEDWMSEGGKWPRAIERNGDTYILMQAHAAWSAWQVAWDCALRFASVKSADQTGGAA